MPTETLWIAFAPVYCVPCRGTCEQRYARGPHEEREACGACNGTGVQITEHNEEAIEGATLEAEV